MIVKVATAPDPLRGFLTMVFVGLGTAPVLFSAAFPPLSWASGCGSSE